MQSLEKINEIEILRLESQEDAIPYRTSFVGAYQSIFAEPPYNERFYPMEAQAIINKNLQTPGHITLLAVVFETVVGFAFAVPVSTRNDVTSKLRGLTPIQHTFYLAELGILESHRRQGLGTALTQWRLKLIDTKRFQC